jgi:hypothetical protein
MARYYTSIVKYSTYHQVSRAVSSRILPVPHRELLSSPTQVNHRDTIPTKQSQVQVEVSVDEGPSAPMEVEDPEVCITSTVHHAVCSTGIYIEFTPYDTA